MNKQISALTIKAQSQEDYDIIKTINGLNSLDSSINTKLFTLSFDLLIPNKKLSILPIFEARYNYGSIITWDLLSLELVKNFPNVSNIIYIQGDSIPWLNANIPYSNWSELFENNKIHVVTKNKEIKEIFSLTWNTRVYDFNYLNEKELYDFIQQTV
jgi:hypothetical protein